MMSERVVAPDAGITGRVSGRVLWRVRLIPNRARRGTQKKDHHLSTGRIPVPGVDVRPARRPDKVNRRPAPSASVIGRLQTAGD